MLRARRDRGGYLGQDHLFVGDFRRFVATLAVVAVVLVPTKVIRHNAGRKLLQQLAPSRNPIAPSSRPAIGEMLIAVATENGYGGRSDLVAEAWACGEHSVNLDRGAKGKTIGGMTEKTRQSAEIVLWECIPPAEKGVISQERIDGMGGFSHSCGLRNPLIRAVCIAEPTMLDDDHDPVLDHRALTGISSNRGIGYIRPKVH